MFDEIVQQSGCSIFAISFDLIKNKPFISEECEEEWNKGIFLWLFIIPCE